MTDNPGDPFDDFRRDFRRWNRTDDHRPPRPPDHQAVLMGTDYDQDFYAWAGEQAKLLG